MPNNSLSYPKVCKRKDGKYYVDFKLNNKRYRLFSGRVIGSSLYPNSYPAKQRYSVTSTLAKEVYRFIVSNDYSLTKVACFILGKVYCKAELTEDDMPVVNNNLFSLNYIHPL